MTSESKITAENIKLDRFVVKNVNGSSEERRAQRARSQGYKSFMDWYKKATGCERKDCCVLKCNGLFEVGAHVIVVGYSKKEYIAPFCRSCNGKDMNLILHEHTILMPLTDNNDRSIDARDYKDDKDRDYKDDKDRDDKDRDDKDRDDKDRDDKDNETNKYESSSELMQSLPESMKTSILSRRYLQANIQSIIEADTRNREKLYKEMANEFNTVLFARNKFTH